VDAGHRLVLADEVLTDPELEPVSEHADTQQRLGVGVGAERGSFLRKRISGFQDDAPDGRDPGAFFLGCFAVLRRLLHPEDRSQKRLGPASSHRRIRFSILFG